MAFISYLKFIVQLNVQLRNNTLHSCHNDFFLINDAPLFEHVACNVGLFDAALFNLALFDAALFDVELF